MKTQTASPVLNIRIFDILFYYPYFVKLQHRMVEAGSGTSVPSSFWISNIILPLVWQWHVRVKFGCDSKSAAMRLWSQKEVDNRDL